MSKSVQIAVVTAALAAGVVLGSILFRQRAEPAPAVSRPAPASKLPDPTGVELARALERIAALESRLRDVESKVAAAPLERRKLILEDLKELAKESTPVVVEGTIDEKDEMPFGWRISNKPGTVASLLGLDAARRKTLEETYQSFVDRIRTLEKENAKVTVDGDTTRIEITPFPQQGKALIDDWSGRIASLLTPDERDKYKKLGLGLLPADIGQHDRIIAIVNEKDGMASSTEHSGQGFSGSYKGPKEMAFAPYRHLLKK